MTLNNRQIYIHYGSTDFDSEKGFPIKNRQPPWCKPLGGFWASRLDATFGWKEWCEREDFRVCDSNESFQFVLKEGARVEVIHDLAKLRSLPILTISEGLSQTYNIDFEKCRNTGIDAIELCWYGDEWKEVAKDDLYFALYGWDCDSIVILNPDIVEVI